MSCHNRGIIPRSTLAPRRLPGGRGRCSFGRLTVLRSREIAHGPQRERVVRSVSAVFYRTRGIRGGLTASPSTYHHSPMRLWVGGAHFTLFALVSSVVCSSSCVELHTNYGRGVEDEGDGEASSTDGAVDDGDTDEDRDDGATSGPAATSTTSPSDDAGTTGASSSTDGSNVGPSLGPCGNGVVDLGEECDDGNGDEQDACRNSCENARCGDGVIWTDEEECDDGNSNDGDECTSECEFTMQSCELDEELVPLDAFNPVSGLGPICNLSNIFESDDEPAGIDRSGPSAEFSNKLVSGCIAVDFGSVQPILNFKFRARSVKNACGYPCSGSACGQNKNVAIFAGEELGKYQLINGYFKLTDNFQDYLISWGKPARYFVLCRGAAGGQGPDIEVDMASAICS